MSEVSQKVAHTNPFPGLRSFEMADASLFFGRDTQIHELRQKLAHSRFLAIVGSSGSGKSSLVKAGLIPQLTNGPVAHMGRTGWKVAFFTPEATPLRNFAAALHQTFCEENRGFATATDLEEVEALLQTRPATIVDWCEQASLLIFIDQFEELFRYQQDQSSADEVTQFIRLLLGFSCTPHYPVYVVLTMRSDYLDECTNYGGLTEAINQGSYLLPKMNRAEIEEAITAPVALMGAAITPALTARLLDDIGDRADHLPILQHALMRTWNHWQLTRKPGQPLDVTDYEAIGTLHQAISVHAEEVYRDLPDERSRLATERLFKALIVLGAGDAGVITPLPVRAISEIAGVKVDLLVDILNRFREPNVAFLNPSTAVPADEDLIVDISHERILNLWERLHTWVREETESAKFYKQVSTAATLYHEGKTGVWANPELQIGLKWLADTRRTQAWADRYDPYLERASNFLHYSKKQFDFEQESNELRQKRELKRTRALAIFLGIGSLISVLFLIIAAVLGTQAQQSEANALAEKAKARAAQEQAESKKREAFTQQKIAEQEGKIARQEGRKTEAAKQEADKKRIEAEAARGEAVTAKEAAEAAEGEAKAQREQALAAKEAALVAKATAEAAEDEAKSQREQALTAKEKAVAAQSYAELQRGKAIARTVAIQSYQMTDAGQDELPALLAVQAYRLNLKTNGQQDNNSEIFNALAKASKAQPPLKAHADYVRAVALAPEASAGQPLLASGSDDGTVKLWPYANLAPQPQPLHTLHTPATSRRNADGLRSLVFAEKGNVVVGGSEKGRLYHWQTHTPDAAPVVLNAHKTPVRALLVAPGAKLLLSVSGDGHVRSWTVGATGLDSLQNVRRSNLAFYCAQLTPDGQRLLCGSDKGQVLSFDVTDLRKAPATFQCGEASSRVTALAFSPNGRRLVTGNALGKLYAWDVRNYQPEPSGRALSGRHTSFVSDIAFSPNGQLLASCSPDWTIHIWEDSRLDTQQQPIVLRDFGDWVMAVRFSPDSKRVIASGADKTVRIRAVDMADLSAELTQEARRDLTPEEWNKYFGPDIKQEKIK